MYIFVRKDFSLAQQIVQAAHVALEAGFRFEKPDSPTHIVLIGVPDESTLLVEHQRLELNGIECEIFHEPDDPINGWTALATRPIYDKKERKLLNKHRLCCS